MVAPDKSARFIAKDSMSILYLLLAVIRLINVQALQCWTCENQSSNLACNENGKPQNCLSNQKACENVVRRGGDGIRITKQCKQAHACQNNFAQNNKPAWDPMQCNSRVPSSMCTCCCGFDMCNTAELACLETSAPELRDIEEESRCPPIEAPEFGEVICEPALNQDTKTASLGTVCSFKCDDHYFIQGKNISECTSLNGNNGKLIIFNSEPPVCIKKSCPDLLSAPENGSKVCSDTDKVGSNCKFECDMYYTRVGSSNSTCIEVNGQVFWNNPVPVCQEIQCEVPVLPHGQVTCNNTNYRVGTTCTFQCVETDYFLYHANATQATCRNDSSWTIDLPCCTRGCPSLKVDFVAVLDSSSSVGRENWEIMKTFVRAVLDSFDVGKNSANLGVFRYNAVVDTKTEIKLKDYTDNKEELLEAFDKIPYDGSGTMTGQALEHAQKVFFKKENGNREDAVDVILVITDGRAQDDLKAREVARELRSEGVIIYVLGIIPPQGMLDVQELIDIAGDKDNVIIATGGFQDLNTMFSTSSNKLSCDNPCEE